MQILNKQHAVLIIEIVSEIILLCEVAAFNIRSLFIEEVPRRLNHLSGLYGLIEHPR